MEKSRFYRFTLLSALVMALFFTGNRLSGQAAELPVITQPTAAPTAAPTEQAPTPPLETLPPVPETVPETSPETQPRDGVWLACQDTALFSDAEHVLVYDLSGGSMLYCSTPAEDTLYPASITKLFSASVALCYLPPDRVVTAGWELGLMKPGSSSAGIALDSRMTVEALIAAMLLPSGNDAAYVLAAAAGRVAAGDDSLPARDAVAAFVDAMNRTAEDAGLVHSHFTGPDGYHDESHYSCPADIGKIARLALGNPVISRYVGMSEDTVRFESGESYTWHNTNRLLNPSSDLYCPDAVGLKTGYTSSAGYCVLAAFCREDREILVGIFGGKDAVSRYSDAVSLFEAAVSAE